MMQAKFNLRSWASNSKKLQQLANTDNVANKDTNVNLLGLKWNISTDTITFTYKEILSSDTLVLSKQTVLQCSSRLYDPLGFLSPVTIQAKIFIQELWQQKITWDGPLQETLRDRWNKIAKEIMDSTKMVLPRCYFPLAGTAKLLSLHVLADASTKAYGAVAYLCESASNG